MPISDMWRDGNGLSTMGEIESNGSCDSVVSFSFSDKSLEYLSPEERACLMYLEETIQSLDTEDDSDLSDDEADPPPAQGNVADKVAHFAASLKLNKLPGQDVPRSQIKNPYSSSTQNEILHPKAPSPFVLANRNSQIQSRPELAASQNNSNQFHQEAPQVPSEVNVVVIPPPFKIKGSEEAVDEQQDKHQPENVAHRGPLSYEALVHLRKSVAMRIPEAKTKEKQVFTNKDHEGSISGSHNSQDTTTRSSKPSPPPVAPKPKMKTPMNQEGASVPKIDLTNSYSEVLSADQLLKPEKVRMEALCKLGILKEDTKNPICQELKHSESKTTREPPSVPAKPGKKINQPVQSFNPAHQRSASDLFSASSHPQHANTTSIWKSATLERTGMGLSASNITASWGHNSSSSTAGSKSHFTDTNESTKEEFRSRGFSVPVPSIGSERREALRKLGFLKN